MTPGRSSSAGSLMAVGLLASAVCAIGMAVVFLAGEREILRARDLSASATAGATPLPSMVLDAMPTAFVRREAISGFSAGCRRRYAHAVQVGCRDAARDALFVCEAVLLAALKRAPWSAYDWALLAKINRYLDRPAGDIAKHMRISATLAPRRMDVALARLEIGLPLYDRLPQDLKSRVRADIAMLTSGFTSARELAVRYMEQESIRNRMITLIEELDPARRRTFVLALRVEIRQASNRSQRARPDRASPSR